MSTTFIQDLKEIYDCRSAFRALVVKNLFGRYKNSVLGFAWHFVLPVIMMCVYYVVFNTIRAKAVPDFWVYMSSGLFPFTFMIGNLNRGPAAITSNSGMVKKMYFPRSILILSEVASSFIVMLIGYAIVFAGILLIGYDMGISLIMLPVVLILMVIFVIGYVLFLSAITVYVRDLQYLINSLSMVFFFITPMYFMMSDVDGILATIIALNPFAYYVQALNQIIYFGAFPDGQIMLMCVIMPLISIIVGIMVFRKLKKSFAERL